MSDVIQAASPRSISVHRLLVQQAIQAKVSFCLDEDSQDVPPLLLFSAAWAQPLVSAYSRLLSILAMGQDAQVLFPCEFKASAMAPLGFVCRERPIDGSAAGLLRAAIVSRAAQEALGFSLFEDQPQRVNFMTVVRQCASSDTLAGQAIRCQSTQDWIKLASSMTLNIPLSTDELPEDAVLQTNKV